MIFRDELVQQGEHGGRTAASDLNSALEAFIANNFPTINTPKIVTSIFANVRALSGLCVKAGVINEHTLFADFVRGFNNSISLFDFIDIGQGTGQASDKIKSTHALFLFVSLMLC